MNQAGQIPEGVRLDPADHHDASWQVHEVLPDFHLLDAWRLPAAGAYEEFSDLAELFLSLDLAEDGESKTSNLLFAARLKIGEVLGWEDEVLSLPIPGCEERSLRDRLSTELRNSTAEIDRDPSELSQVVFLTENEALIELSNSTVHAAIHLAWVAADEIKGFDYVGQMGIYVKTRGRLGRLYMPAIAPFRHFIVYPALMRRIGRAWQERKRDLRPAR